MRILFIGDIVGKGGLDLVTETMPGLRREQSLDLVIANGENSDGGSGITPSIYRRLLQSGVDAVTLGDHIYRKKEIIDVLDASDRVVKPANYPPTAPGREWVVVRGANGVSAAVFSLMGRVYMKPVDCPFTAAERVLNAIPPEVTVKIVDFHAEATSDKYLMGRFLDGRVSAVLGTHTHVPTADEQIFPGGTAFQCDVGMTGPHESILGRNIDNVLQAALTFRPIPFAVAKNDQRINGALVTVDAKTGKALKIERVSWNEKQCSLIQDAHDEED